MKRSCKSKMGVRPRLLFWSAGLALLAATIASFAGPFDVAQGKPLTDTFPAALPSRTNPDIPNDQCLFCHGEANKILDVGDSQVLLTIDEAAFDQSVHGQEQVSCNTCHADIATFPHPDYAKTGLREFNYSLYQATQNACKNCHEEEANNAMTGVHALTLDEGNHNAAMCADCHNPHYSKGAAEPQEVPDVCARCHNDVAAQYKASVHGESLLADANPDVPTCVTCHGSHSIGDPGVTEFRNNIPLLCAKCHTDASIMDKYGISTNVLSTYVADYHGTTVTIFQQTSPDLPTNKPVCVDCHGTHDISKTDDSQTGIALKENLLGKCQRCHPNATANFPDAWMSHYDASPEKFPLVYYVNLFYKFFIPTVLGGMALFVVTDIIRRLINRRKGIR